MLNSLAAPAVPFAAPPLIPREHNHLADTLSNMGMDAQEFADAAAELRMQVAARRHGAASPSAGEGAGDGGSEGDEGDALQARTMQVGLTAATLLHTCRYGT